MPIRKLDGYLDSGTVVFSGDAIVEIVFSYDDETQHEVALKFRTAPDEATGLQVENPVPDRTLIHFVNYPNLGTIASNVKVGKIGTDEFALSYVIQNFIPDIRWLTYSLYALATKTSAPT